MSPSSEYCTHNVEQLPWSTALYADALYIRSAAIAAYSFLFLNVKLSLRPNTHSTSDCSLNNASTKVAFVSASHSCPATFWKPNYERMTECKIVKRSIVFDWGETQIIIIIVCNNILTSPNAETTTNTTNNFILILVISIRFRIVCLSIERW